MKKQQNGSQEPERATIFSIPGPAETTGRYLVAFRSEAASQASKILGQKAGLTVATASEFEGGGVDPDKVAGADAVLFDQLGVAVVTSMPDQISSLAAESEGGGILAIEPERVSYALQRKTIAVQEDALPVDILSPQLDGYLETPEIAEAPTVTVSQPVAQYLRGYKAAVDQLVTTLVGGWGAPAEVSPEDALPALHETVATWGLQATRVIRSTRSGKGVRVAMLDTGLDLRHPDFRGRTIATRSFITGETVQDGHGHGTHVVGTACGPQRPAVPPRYGVAYGCDIFVGKVLSNAGSGADAGILAGINWAIASRCKVVSMSLGAPARPGEPPSAVYETVARRALDRGTLIIAAAGNDSDRRAGIFRPVSRPANSHSIMAVAALDVALRVANFSNRAINPNGGEVNLIGPGVDVYSTWPLPTRYRRISGTSMATPHVSGMAALIAEASPSFTARQIWRALQSMARRLAIPAADGGAGLGQAP